MRWSSPPLLGLWLGGRAWAGACCLGATGTMPTRLGECERWLIGVDLGGESLLGQRDSAGQLAASSLQEQAVVSRLAAGWRWSRRAQLSVLVPARYTARSAGEDADGGGGIGDVQAGMLWDPLAERPSSSSERGVPVPVFSAGLRLPTGRGWREPATPRQADVTGLPGAALQAGVMAERTLNRTPWSVGLAGELPVASSRAGLQVVRGRMLRWRAWAGGEVDVPVPGVGQANPRLALVSAGAALVR